MNQFDFNMHYYSWDGEKEESMEVDVNKNAWEDEASWYAKIINHKTPEGEEYTGGRLVQEDSGRFKVTENSIIEAELLKVIPDVYKKPRQLKAIK